MSDSLEFRLAGPDDRDDILELVRISLGEGTVPRSLDYWRWKHEENVFGPSATLVATAQAELVGLRTFMRWRWRSGDASISAVRAVDTATHPDWRGKGIFSKLTLTLLETMKDERVAFVFNTPNEKSRPGYLKMGWENVGRPTIWIRPVRPASLILGLRGSTGAASDEGADMSSHVGQDPMALCEAHDLEGFLGDIETPRSRLCTPMTPEYLKWRYARVPELPYRAVWELQGETGAAVVFRMRSRGSMRELRLCEILVGRGRPSRKVARDLIGDLVRSTSADYASAMSPRGCRSAPVLGRVGFLPVPRLGPILTVRPVATGPRETPDPTHRSSWRVSIGDLELF